MLQYTLKLCNKTLISRRMRSTRVACEWSRRDHMTDASLRGNQLVSNWFPAALQVLVAVWFPIQLPSLTTLLRVRARRHVESNQFRPIIGLHQVSNVWDNNIFNIINIRPTIIAIDKIHIQPIFFSLRYVFKPSDSGYMRDSFNMRSNATNCHRFESQFNFSCRLCSFGQN